LALARENEGGPPRPGVWAGAGTSFCVQRSGYRGCEGPHHPPGRVFLGRNRALATARQHGPSPRARGSPPQRAAQTRGQRSIPACAGLSPGTSLSHSTMAVHPRVRGALRCFAPGRRCAHGPSPRARGWTTTWIHHDVSTALFELPMTRSALGGRCSGGRVAIRIVSREAPDNAGAQGTLRRTFRSMLWPIPDTTCPVSATTWNIQRTFPYSRPRPEPTAFVH